MTATTDKWNGEAIPSIEANLKLRDIIKTIPKEYFLKNRAKAWFTVVWNVLAVIIGYVAIAYSPWYLLPLAWIFTGTALTGFFVIAHDCGHRSFANRRWVNDLVGHTLLLPLIYPFHCWRYLHDRHHAKTNMVTVDNAWDPWELEAFQSTNILVRWFYQAIRGRLWWIGSIFHWGILHFDTKQFTDRERDNAVFSMRVVIIFAILFFPTLIYFTGFWGLIKFWFLPWMVYHFWMSTFTIVHHTDPDIQFVYPHQWNQALAQLEGTVHCTYPRWVEILCHDINVHIPHHISTAIPSYNLRKVHASLQENWSDYDLKETSFSWNMMKRIVDRCHIFDSEVAYKTFREVRK
jgi:acyl-lipid omega-6 desaturase (Delta-12 desaturase)